MFATLDGTVDQARERRREARRCELRSLCEQEARIKARVTEIVREADDDGIGRRRAAPRARSGWRRSQAATTARAKRITSTSEALRSLPALDQALGAGVLTLDQVAAAAEFATPASDAELARVAVGKPPSEIAVAARTLAPPKLEDDQTLYQRRSLSMTWTRGRRELAISGRLPLEQGAAFEQAIWNIAKTQRAADKQAGTVLEWQQSAADALVTLARQGGGSEDGSSAQPDHPDRAPQRRRAAAAGRRRADQPRDRPTTHLRRAPAHHQAAAAATSCTHASDAAPPTPSNARCTNAQRTASTPAAPPPANSKHTTSPPSNTAAQTELDNLILLCPRHHKLLHDHHIHTSGTGHQPLFEDQAGRAITTNQPHAPPR